MLPGNHLRPTSPAGRYAIYAQRLGPERQALGEFLSTAHHQSREAKTGADSCLGQSHALLIWQARAEPRAGCKYRTDVHNWRGFAQKPNCWRNVLRFKTSTVATCRRLKRGFRQSRWPSTCHATVILACHSHLFSVLTTVPGRLVKQSVLQSPCHAHQSAESRGRHSGR